MTRGRKLGYTEPGSVSGWLKRAKPGEVLWTEQPSQQVESTAGRIGVVTRTMRCIAVHPGSRTVYEVTRVEVLEETP
jgi:hypothetical protein